MSISCSLLHRGASASAAIPQSISCLQYVPSSEGDQANRALLQGGAASCSWHQQAAGIACHNLVRVRFTSANGSAVGSASAAGTSRRFSRTGFFGRAVETRQPLIADGPNECSSNGLWIRKPCDSALPPSYHHCLCLGLSSSPNSNRRRGTRGALRATTSRTSSGAADELPSVNGSAVGDPELKRDETGEIGHASSATNSYRRLSANTNTSTAAAAAAAAAAASASSAAGVGTSVLDRVAVTGGAFDHKGATAPLVLRSLPSTKTIVLVRHGLSSWNEESRVQGSSDQSVLSEKGRMQASRCREALRYIPFDMCFASPISRARTSAEIIWEGRKEPLIFLDSLKEANLLFLEGMRNADALEQYPDLYKAWREDPAEFHVNGVYPVVNLWERARQAWEELLSTPGEKVLVVTHKSIMRSLLCTALGLGPDKFRCVDVNNGGVSIFCVNPRGEPMLQNSNLTAHLYVDNVYYNI
ncbi:hypothetical protein CBR_g51943 [Chara braunii]|uniref:Uncharacterized protein n=1 Tax=Chara braunii TaxID=69332 RepID=A0A388K6S2_CHABU|nr:hypothetical protein CBR_g51943 [Chara braunii]|eukprot:GBG65643.1 hypothetical protein CBR_g51943 [Chara braunii]